MSCSNPCTLIPVPCADSQTDKSHSTNKTMVVPATPAPNSLDVFSKDLMKGKVVFVTGGGSGIGLGMAKGFAKHGAKVAICGRTESKLIKAVEELKEAGAVEAMWVKADVRDPAQCEAATAAVGEKWGVINVLINNAAGNFMSLLEDMSAKAFQTVLDIDLKGVFNMSRAALPWLKKANGGSVVLNISATLQYRAMPFQGHAAAAKAAIDVLTNTMGVEWADYGIRAVGIAPGPISGTEGGPTGRVFGEFGMAKMDTRFSVPVGRYGETQDIANVALFLASPAASWITSTTIAIDGANWHAAGPFLVAKDRIRKAMQAQRAAHQKKRTAKL
eukprot:Sspe_Gene.32917::Locus_16113_Transcript_1_1_Confidence_1.000_Length_1948::g.32917::m.32917/K13237/DECR2; peroxisomal 2,4-dienoyl-CoA reductase